MSGLRLLRISWLLSGTVCLLAVAAAASAPYRPASPELRAPMGESLVVESRGDGSQTLYTTTPDGPEQDCRATAADGSKVPLVRGFPAADMPGPPTWYSRGFLREPGPVTLRCDDPRGGEFGVGASRNLGFLIKIVLLYVLAVLTGLPALVLMIVDLAGRRRDRTGPGHRSGPPPRPSGPPPGPPAPPGPPPAPPSGPWPPAGGRPGQ